MSDDENDGDDEQQLPQQKQNQRPEPLPARYTADGKSARWEMLWLDRCGRGRHVDDDGADGSQKVDGVLPPLPDDLREESKRQNASALGHRQ